MQLAAIDGSFVVTLQGKILQVETSTERTSVSTHADAPGAVALDDEKLHSAILMAMECGYEIVACCPSGTVSVRSFGLFIVRVSVRPQTVD